MRVEDDVRGQQIAGDSPTRVAHRDHDVAARLNLAVHAGVVLVEHDILVSTSARRRAEAQIGAFDPLAEVVGLRASAMNLRIVP